MTSKAEEASAPEFEDALRELEALVDTLEKGELTLEGALGAFERAITLTRACQKALDEAEQKVQILTGKSEEERPETFNDDA